MSTSAVIDIQKVRKQFKVKNEVLPVLEDLTLSVQPGEFLAIVGASGCGKSTLLRLLVGLDRDYQGEIKVGGHAVTGTSLDRGIVFQEHRLFPWLTLEQNVGLGLQNSDWSEDEKKRAIADHIELVGLKGFESAYPHQLSGGMAQRAAIARGLMRRPRVLLLDEPFSAVDAFTRMKLQDLLLRIAAHHQLTILQVTHDIDEALYLSDRILVLPAGGGPLSGEFSVPAARPRSRSDAGLLPLKDRVLDLLHLAEQAG